MRLAATLLEEAQYPLRFWYLSFVDDDGFRGGVIIEAPGFVTAVHRTHELHISPGGEVAGAPIPEGQVPTADFHERLLSLEELTTVWGAMTRLSDMEDETKPKD